MPSPSSNRRRNRWLLASIFDWPLPIAFRVNPRAACRRRAGWPWVLPPRAPTDPYVPTLEHTVPLMLDSPYNQTLHARIAILGRYGDTWFQVQSLGRISRPRVQQQTPPFGFSFPPPGPAGPVPRLHQYYEGATTSCSHPAALRFLRLAVPRLHSLLSLPGGRVRRQGLELVTRYLRPGICRGANRILPSSWGTTIVRLRMFQSDAGRTACTKPLQCSSVAPERPSAKAPTIRSIDAQ